MNVLETKVGQGDAFAGSGEQRPVLGIAKRSKSLGIAQDGHVAHGVEKDHVVGTVETAAQIAKHLQEIGPLVLAKLIAQIVHDDFGVEVLRQMIVGQREQFVAQIGEVGELAVEGHGEPFPFAAMLAFKRLSEGAVVGATGGIAGMADGGPAREFLHDAVVFGLMIEPKRLDDRADLLVGIEDLAAVGIVGAEASRQLPAILQIQQQPRHEPRNIVLAAGGHQRRRRGAVKMIDRGNPTLMVKFGHGLFSPFA